MVLFYGPTNGETSIVGLQYVYVRSLALYRPAMYNVCHGASFEQHPLHFVNNARVWSQLG